MRRAGVPIKKKKKKKKKILRFWEEEEHSSKGPIRREGGTLTCNDIVIHKGKKNLYFLFSFIL